MTTLADRTQSGGPTAPTLESGAASKQFVEQAQKTVQDVQAMGGMAKDIAQEKLENLRASASEYKDQGRERVQQAERTIEQFIQERPVKSVLIAAGIGLFFGRFWMRR